MVHHARACWWRADRSRVARPQLLRGHLCCAIRVEVEARVRAELGTPRPARGALPLWLAWAAKPTEGAKSPVFRMAAESGPAASKPISIMAATIVAEVAKRCGTAVRVTKCRIASGGSPSSDRVRPSGGFACGFVGNPLRGHLRQWCVRPGLPTTPQAQHQQKKPDFSRFKGSDRSAEGSREHGRSAEHVGRSKDGKPRWMTRFHRGDPCPAIRWHRTRTKRTDHELQKPDTLTS